MTLEFFNNLDFTEKGLIVFGEGASFVGFRYYYNQKLVLYDCGSFFAEVYYSPEGNEITKIDGFAEDDKRLDLYIDFMKTL